MRLLADPEGFLRRCTKHLFQALVLAFCVLVVVLFWQPRIDGVPPSKDILDVTALIRPHDPKLDPLASTYDFVDRPLFERDRRPADVALAEVELAPAAEIPETTELEGYTLSGIVSSGDISAAMLIGKDKERFRLRVGESVEGWTLQSVDLRSALLTSGLNGTGKEIRLTMDLAAIPMLLSAALQIDDREDVRSDSNLRGDEREAGPDPVSGFEAMDEAKRERAQKKPRRRVTPSSQIANSGGESKRAVGSAAAEQ